MKRVRLPAKKIKMKRTSDFVPIQHGAGRPRTYYPTEKDRRFATRMASYAIPRKEIAASIINPRTGEPISLQTLDVYYGEDMRAARLAFDGQVSRSLHTLAIGREAEFIKVTENGKKKLKVTVPFIKPDINAIRWYEMTRKGFSEKTAQQALDAQGNPTDPIPVVVILPSNGRDLPAVIDLKAIRVAEQLALPPAKTK